MVEQTFLSPQLKRSVIINSKLTIIIDKQEEWIYVAIFSLYIALAGDPGFPQNDELSAIEMMKGFHKFSLSSGLRQTQQALRPNTNLRNILQANKKIASEENFVKNIVKIEKVLKICTTRYLTIECKVTDANSIRLKLFILKNSVLGHFSSSVLFWLSQIWPYTLRIKE